MNERHWGWWDNAWLLIGRGLDWIVERIVEIMMTVAVVMVIGGFVFIVVHGERDQARRETDQIAQCVRLFGYTQEQCAFIVHNHVMMGR